MINRCQCSECEFSFSTHRVCGGQTNCPKCGHAVMVPPQKGEGRATVSGGAAVALAARVCAGIATGALAGPLFLAVCCAIACGIQRGIPMVEFPDFTSAAIAGFFFSLALLGIPAAFAGATIGGFVGFVRWLCES